MTATILSWIGSIFVLTAFALNIRGKIAVENIIYIGLNFFGSAFLGISAYINHGYAFVTVNAAWVIFALYSFAKRYTGDNAKA